MINDIKSNNLNISSSVANNGKTSRPALDTRPAKDNDNDQDDVTVTPELGKLATALASSNESEDLEQTDTLQRLKLLINNNEYKLNLETLADRLSKNVLIN